jgi:hypothetical protein
MKTKHSANTPRARHFAAVLLALTLITLIGGCGSTMEFTARRPEKPIEIDGNDADWHGATTYIEDSKVAVGFAQDGNTLSICVLTTDRTMEQQIMHGGITIWFDSTGSDDEYYGVRFPVPPAEGGMMPRMERGRDASASMPDPEEMRKQMMSRSNEIELVCANPLDNRRVQVPSSEGYKAKLGMIQERFIYEVQVPTPHVGAKGVLGVGFTTPEQKIGSRPRMDGPTDAPTGRPGMGRGGERDRGQGGDEGMGGMGSGGQGGPGGQGGMGPGGLRGSSAADQIKQLKLWVRVKKS